MVGNDDITSSTIGAGSFHQMVANAKIQPTPKYAEQSIILKTNQQII